ncbi:uncharacterized protein LOC127248851 [Andrographis paniculata]|uniref:uncharacterized protein LOC127248851 n=1 Tax=Andrographis paniculata TaxID=175694 RepID=UPI0021E91136|nr:uncharacterized protein LOC127248851 [Andrographis paniculata]
MANPPESAVQDCAPPWRSVVTIPILMKGVFLVCCVFGAFSLCYLAFPISRWHLNCPECDASLIHAASLRRFDFEEKTAATDISHILFGIGGSAETWGRRRQYCELWWEAGVTRGFVWLDKEPKVEAWPETSPPYKVSEDTSRFKYSNWYGSRSAVRMARIVKESFELGLEKVRWFVMGDDDTVFFKENLLSVLNKYDHRQMYYIGGISESIEQDLVHSYTMGYGGAGFAVSYPLAAELVRILDGCIDRYAESYGSDQKIGACMSEIGVPVTKELGFHQMDIRGSPVGLLSAHPLAPLVSLHHLDYLQPLFPGASRVESVRKMMEVYGRDHSRMLQQSVCYDLTRNWSISVAWGYNVQVYPWLVTARVLSTPLQTFLTWGTWSRGPFVFNTRPLSLNPCERPLTFYLDRLEENATATATTTSYRMSAHTVECRDHTYAAVNALKGFNVAAAVLDPAVLTQRQAPRRQCCEIIHESEGEGEGGTGSMVHLRIRECHLNESVTPP